ncbi:MAG: Ig domain-containing protein, partial [candidate division KSB1 bacterium]
IYLGGSFRSIGGTPRNRVAAVDMSNGSVTAWNPNAGEIVYAVDIDCVNRRTILGGLFTRMGNSSAGGLSIYPAGDRCPTPASDAGVEDGGTSEIDAGVDLPRDAFVFLVTPRETVQCATAYAAWTNGGPEMSESGPHVFSLEGDIPEGLELNATTGALAWTPTNQQARSYSMTLHAQGAASSASLPFTVTVECDSASYRLGCASANFNPSMALAAWALMTQLRRRRRPKIDAEP